LRRPRALYEKPRFGVVFLRAVPWVCRFAKPRARIMAARKCEALLRADPCGAAWRKPTA
jgi:hypothetical protein